MKTSIKSVKAGWDATNIAAARIIAGDTSTYPPGSLMALWAALVIEANTRTVDGPLFESRAA